MSDLSWVFEVVDKSSGPLKNIDDKLKVLPNDLNQVETALKKVDEAAKLQALSRMPALKQASVLLKDHAAKLRESKLAEEKTAAAKKVSQQKMLENAKAKYEQNRKAQQAAIQREMAQVKAFKEKIAAAKVVEQQKSEQLIGELVNVAGMGASFAVGLGTAFLGAAMALTKFGIAASQAKTAGVGMLQPFEGARSEKAFDVLQRMGIAAGQSADETARAFQKLRSAGFASKSAQDVLAASFDIAGLLGGGEQGKQGGDKFREMFAKLALKGKAEGEDFKVLSEIGVGLDPLAEALGRRLKVDAKTAKALMQSGAANGVDLQNSILDVVQKKINGGGALGTKALSSASKSVDAQMQSLGDNAKRIFQDVNVQPFVDALAQVNKALAGDTGARIKVLANNFFQLFEAGGKLNLVRALEVTVDIVEQLWTKAETFGAAFEKAFDTPFLADFNAVLNDVDAKLGIAPSRGADGFAALGKVIGTVATGFVVFLRVLETIDRVIAKIGDGVKGLATGAFSKVVDIASKGSAAVEGLAQGLLSGKTDITAAAAKLGNLIPQTVAGELEIRSPSRVMDRLGENAGNSLMGGFEGTQPSISVDDVVSAPSITLGDIGASGRGSVSVQIGDIVVPAGGDAGRIARELAGRVREEMLKVFEEMGYA